MPLIQAQHKAPRGQYRVLMIDRDTGSIETRDFLDAHDAHGFIHETADDRPWITMHVIDDRGEEVL